MCKTDFTSRQLDLIDRLYEKFPELDESFDFQGFTRKGEPSRTYFIFKCLVCGEIIEKEQYTLLNQKSIQSVRCPNCSTRKSPEPITESQLLLECKVFGSEFLSMRRENSQVYVTFKCSCGSPREVVRRLGRLYLCKDCEVNYMKQSPKNKTSIEEVRAWFRSYGAEPLFDEYIDANHDLSFRCKCGNISKIRFSRKSEGFPVRCRECRDKDFRGENHPNWKGIPESIRRRRGNQIKTWEKDVFKRCSGKCIVTGNSVRSELCVHHLYSYGDYPDLRIDPLNGLVITKILHREFHLEYGYGHNTLEQFLNFFESKTGKRLTIETVGPQICGVI